MEQRRTKLEKERDEMIQEKNASKKKRMFNGFVMKKRKKKRRTSRLEKKKEEITEITEITETKKKKMSLFAQSGLKFEEQIENQQNLKNEQLSSQTTNPLSQTIIDNLTSCLFSHSNENSSEETITIFKTFHNNNEKMKLIFLCGASGVGKTWTLIDFAFQNYSLSFFTLSVHSGRKIL
ncbi:flagellar biosynthesis protein flhf [Anaeramoeba flamelloides]|uniref:Flagellar biosynthesis protein flhf n=1 Tax=Anaeramoeba flamelloides TaxID=1746091 RepID=A0AAV7YNV1_9EUKA|nr:flagellar biosynthesis protein flhf [Anaeramoeba flamelloides]